MENKVLTQLLKNPFLGKLVTFEGIDGSGKSDQFKMIRDTLLLVKDTNVIFTKEPPNNSVGVGIYDILRGRHPSITLESISEIEMQRKYFLGRRMQYQDLYLPTLRAGVHVVSDRGLVSVAYGIKNIEELNQFMMVQKAMFDYYRVPLITPDLNLIFDVPVEVALERLGKKERDKDKFEQQERLEIARANYLAIGQEIPNCVIINGNRSVEDVFVDTKRYVFQLLGLQDQ